MSLNKIMARTRHWFAAFFRDQAEMSAQTELFLEVLPWRIEQ